MLPGRGIARRITWSNVGAVVGLLRATITAIGLVRRRRPRVVVSLGGYASFPATVAAVVCRVPLVVTEQNATAGLANRVAGRFARASAVPFAGTGLPREVLTGNPVRAEVSQLADESHRSQLRSAVRAGLSVDDGVPLVVVFSGSLGARRVNEAVTDLACRWAHRPVVVHHVTGTRDLDLVTARVAGHADTLAAGVIDYRLVPYEPHMERLLAAADVVICRSGGTSVAEIAVAGVPAILIPLPGAPRDHQRANAAPLADAGGAIVIDDAACTAERLDEVVSPLLDAPAQREAMAAALRGIARGDAADRVAALVEEHARAR
jgi:UDP-N-acetylglucosamine:LPS N-acetylglucosamine transferase